MSRGRVRTARGAALLIAGLLTACHSSPPVYQPPDRSRKPDPEQAALANMQMALEYLRLSNLAQARERIERALAEAPDNAYVQETAGLVYEQLKDSSKAQRAFSDAARLGKRDPAIANSYAGFLCRNGKVSAGEKLFLEVAGNPLYPTPEVALVNAGVCVGGAGDAVDSERYFKRALAIRPNMPEALLELGNLELERGDAAQALDIVQRYLAVNPATAEILWLGFRAERKLGDDAAAAAYGRRIESEFPTSQPAQSLRSGVSR